MTTEELVKALNVLGHSLSKEDDRKTALTAADTIDRQAEAIRVLRDALSSAKCYVEAAVNADGGIDQCEIGYRIDFEKATEALAQTKEFGE